MFVCCFPLAEKRNNELGAGSQYAGSNGHEVWRVFQFYVLPSTWPDLPAHPPMLEGTKEIFSVLYQFFCYKVRHYCSMVSTDSWSTSDSLPEVVALSSSVNIGKSSVYCNKGQAVWFNWHSFQRCVRRYKRQGWDHQKNDCNVRSAHAPLMILFCAIHSPHMIPRPTLKSAM